MNWLCWHVGTVTDPKFRLIAKRANVPTGVAVAVWAYLLELAADAKERGSIESFDAEIADEALGFGVDAIRAVFDQIEAREMIDGARIAKWGERQNLTNAERAKEWRKKKAERNEQTDVRDVRANTPNETNTTDRQDIHTDRQTKKEDAAPPPDVASLAFDAGVRVIAARVGGERQARTMVGKWRKDHGDAAVIDAIGQCQRAGPSEPISYITAVLNRQRAQPPPKRTIGYGSQPG